MLLAMKESPWSPLWSPCSLGVLVVLVPHVAVVLCSAPLFASHPRCRALFDVLLCRRRLAPVPSLGPWCTAMESLQRYATSFHPPDVLHLKPRLVRALLVCVPGPCFRVCGLDPALLVVVVALQAPVVTLDATPSSSSGPVQRRQMA
jgi:hypothetical protein